MRGLSITQNYRLVKKIKLKLIKKELYTKTSID